MNPMRLTKKKGKDDGEKPFWISFSDLMTALMVMFLVVMAVALLAVTSPNDKRQQEVEEWIQQLEKEIKKDYPNLEFQRSRRVIDFKDQANFEFGKSYLMGLPNEKMQKEESIRKFIPALLRLANSDLGKKVVKRVVVEGYTDKTGTYLSNLDLSLKRSERILCILLADNGNFLLPEEEKKQVRELFLVGGYSFNNIKLNDEESRRVEMRIEFLGPLEQRLPVPLTVVVGSCPL